MSIPYSCSVPLAPLIPLAPSFTSLAPPTMDVNTSVTTGDSQPIISDNEKYSILRSRTAKMIHEVEHQKEVEDYILAENGKREVLDDGLSEILFFYNIITNLFEKYRGLIGEMFKTILIVKEDIHSLANRSTDEQYYIIDLITKGWSDMLNIFLYNLDIIYLIIELLHAERFRMCNANQDTLKRIDILYTEVQSLLVFFLNTSSTVIEGYKCIERSIKLFQPDFKFVDFNKDPIHIKSSFIIKHFELDE